MERGGGQPGGRLSKEERDHWKEGGAKQEVGARRKGELASPLMSLTSAWKRTPEAEGAAL